MIISIPMNTVFATTSSDWLQAWVMVIMIEKFV
jgi:hypothetical protein